MTTKAKKDYSQGKIYKIEPIVEHDEGDIYIGSTTKKYLSQRMTAHRKDYKRWIEGKKGHMTSFILFQKYGIQNCEIILIEDVDTTTHDGLVSKEAFYIKSFKCVNKYVPFKTEEERKKSIKEQSKMYSQQNKEKIQNYQMQYRNEHKEEICLRNQQYGMINKEAKKQYNSQYYEKNKDIIKQQTKEYREMNREKINAKQNLAYQKKKQQNESDEEI